MSSKFEVQLRKTLKSMGSDVDEDGSIVSSAISSSFSKTSGRVMDRTKPLRGDMTASARKEESSAIERERREVGGRTSGV